MKILLTGSEGFVGGYLRKELEKTDYIVYCIDRVKVSRINYFCFDLTDEVLSLEKLFKDQIGVPITKYRLRYRVFIGIIQLALGRSVTEAALTAGFASSAHFSKSFTAINGIPPSTTFLKPPYLEVLIAREIVETMNTHSIFDGEDTRTKTGGVFSEHSTTCN